MPLRLPLAVLLIAALVWCAGVRTGDETTRAGTAFASASVPTLDFTALPGTAKATLDLSAPRNPPLAVPVLPFDARRLSLAAPRIAPFRQSFPSGLLPRPTLVGVVELRL